jgi:hypothetical protein
VSKEKSVCRRTPSSNQLPQSLGVSKHIRRPRDEDRMKYTGLLQTVAKVFIGKLTVYPSLPINSPRALEVKNERYGQNLFSLNLQVSDLLERRNPGCICCGIFFDNQPFPVHWWWLRVRRNGGEPLTTPVPRVNHGPTQHLLKRLW